jgi:transcriptional regulator with XRE-family HTH domain
MQPDFTILEEISSKEQPLVSKKAKPCASDADHKIGVRIFIAREEIGLTRLEVANALNITQQQIEKYEKGQNRISARTLFIASKVLNKPMKWFTQDLQSKNSLNLLMEHRRNRLALHTIKVIKGIKDKPTQNKIIKVIKILLEEVEQQK